MSLWIFQDYFKKGTKMIQTYSATIRRKEMEAVLTCMFDEKIGPGEMNEKLVQTAKELIGFRDGMKKSEAKTKMPLHPKKPLITGCR